MTNGGETKRWLADAEDGWRVAETTFESGQWRAAVQNAQLAIELSAKAVIAFMTEPEWTHDPGRELSQVIEDLLASGGKRWPAPLLDGLRRLAEDTEFAGPWHGRSVYGEHLKDGTRRPAVEVCDRPVAEDLLLRARRSIWTAFSFLCEVVED